MTTTTQKFTEGADVYLRDGIKAVYCMETPVGHVVTINVGQHDEEGEWWGESESRVVRAVYAKPQTSLIDERIDILRVTAEQLTFEIAEKRDALRQQEQEAKANLDVLSRWSGFETLRAFISGEITHIVTEGYRGPRIQKLEDALKGDDSVGRRNLRLVSLFGKSDGDYEWGLNRYSDGSGSWEQIHPAASEEAARAKVRALWLERVDRWRADTTKWNAVDRWDKRMSEMGIDVPADVADALFARRVAGKEDRVSKLRDDVTKAESELATLVEEQEAKRAERAE